MKSWKISVAPVAALVIIMAVSLLYDGWTDKRQKSASRFTIGIGQIALAAQTAGAPAGTNGVPIILGRRAGWSNTESGGQWSGLASYRSIYAVEFTWSTDVTYFSDPDYPINNPDDRTALAEFTDSQGRKLVLIHLPLDYKPTLNPDRVTDPRRPPREAEFNVWVQNNPDASFAVDEIGFHGGWLGKLDAEGNFVPGVFKDGGGQYQSRFPLLPMPEDLSGLHCLLQPGGDPNYIEITVSWQGVTNLPPNQSEPPLTAVIMVYAMISPMSEREEK